MSGSYLRIHGIVDPDCFGDACVIGLGQLGMLQDGEKELDICVDLNRRSHDAGFIAA